jgi:hypothetical protein
MIDTISINHNWANGCNVDLVWQRLESDFWAVTQELEDCKGTEGWDEECQKLLKAYAGWDFGEFVRFLLLATETQFQVLATNDERDTAKDREREEKELLAIFNLTRIIKALSGVLENSSPSEEWNNAKEMLARAKEYVEKAKSVYISKSS